MLSPSMSWVFHPWRLGLYYGCKEFVAVLKMSYPLSTLMFCIFSLNLNIVSLTWVLQLAAALLCKLLGVLDSLDVTQWNVFIIPGQNKLYFSDYKSSLCPLVYYGSYFPNFFFSLAAIDKLYLVWMNENVTYMNI